MDESNGWARQARRWMTSGAQWALVQLDRARAFKRALGAMVAQPGTARVALTVGSSTSAAGAAVHYRGRQPTRDVARLFWDEVPPAVEATAIEATDVEPAFEVGDALLPNRRQGVFYTPPLVTAEAPLTGNYASYEASLAKDHRRALKLGERLGLQCRSGSPHELARFREELLVPTSLLHHGPGAVVPSLAELEAHGGNLELFWVERGEERLGGGLVLRSRWRERVEHWRVGLAASVRGDKKLTRAVYTALDARALRYAFDVEARVFSLGRTLPCASDGLFLYKRRWGMRFVATGAERWLCWRPRGEAAREVLARRPLLVWTTEFRANPVLLTATLGPHDEREALTELWHAAHFPGLQGVLVLRPGSVRPAFYAAQELAAP